MGLILLNFAIGAAVAALLWFIAGRWIVMLLDHVFRGREETIAAEPLAIDDRRVLIGSRAWKRDGPAKFTFNVHLNEQHHLIISNRGRSIVLGPVTRRMSGDDGIYNYFTAGNGDVVRFTRRRSRGSWPMPWEWFRIMGAGRKRGRFVYHRFTWANPTGQQLTLSWRDEQWLYRGAREWIEAYIERIVEMRISKARS